MTSPYAVPVVRIVAPVAAGNPDGFTEINESDFDAKKHKKFVEREKTKAELKAEAEEAAKLAAEKEAADKAEAEAKLAASAAANSFANAAGKAPPPAA